MLRGDHRGIRGEVNVGDQRDANLSPIELLANGGEVFGVGQ